MVAPFVLLQVRFLAVGAKQKKATNYGGLFHYSVGLPPPLNGEVRIRTVAKESNEPG